MRFHCQQVQPMIEWLSSNAYSTLLQNICTYVALLLFYTLYFDKRNAKIIIVQLI